MNFGTSKTSEPSAKTTTLWPLREFGGEGPSLHFAVGNGFPPDSYRAFLSLLTARYRVASLVPRPLWETPGPLNALDTWDHLADDYARGMVHHGLDQIVALGHSMGAIAAMLQASRNPQRFRALVMLDPTCLSPKLRSVIRNARRISKHLEHLTPLSRSALKRRTLFASKEEAYNAWKTKRFFKDWPDAVLRDYVESMLKPTSAPSTNMTERGGTQTEAAFTLAWPPSWEAKGYRSLYTEAAKSISTLPQRVPALLIRGEQTNALSMDSVIELKEACPHLEVQTISGHGHAFPHTAPKETAERVLSFLANSIE